MRAIARRRGGGLPRQRRGAAATQRTTSADRCPRPRSTTDATRPPHLAPSASPTPPRPRRLGGAGARDSGGACVPFSRLGLHQSERCGNPTDDVRGPVPAPGRHDGREAASASRALGQPYTAAASSPRWRGHPQSRRRLRPFLASLGRHQSSPATAQALSAARSCRGLAHSPRGRAARTSPAARDSGRSAIAAANAPGQQCVRSRTTSGAMPRPVAAARRRIAKHSKLAPLLSPPPPRRFGQELLETSDLSIRRPYSELAPCRAARGELRGQSAPSAASGCVGGEHAAPEIWRCDPHHRGDLSECYPNDGQARACTTSGGRPRTRILDVKWERRRGGGDVWGGRKSAAHASV